MSTIPVSSSLTQINAELFLQEGFELSLDAIIPSIELTGSYTPFESKTQFYIYNYAKEILYSNLNYKADGSFLSSPSGTSTSNSTSNYNQFELTPTEDIYNQGYSNGNYYAVYNFINYELGSETKIVDNRTNTVGSGDEIAYYDTSYSGHPYFIKDISGDRTELRIQNNYLSSIQIKNYYNTFKNKIDLRENADEFYVSFGDNRNFIAVNSQLEVPVTGSSNVTSILIKLYKPLPAEFKVDKSIQIISKVGETQAFEVQFKPNLQFIDNLLSLKGPNYNIDLKDRVNNSTNFKTLDDLINTNSSQSYYQLNSLQDERGVILRKNWADWSQFVKYSSAEQRLSNFQSKMTLIENYKAELANLSTIASLSQTSLVFSSSYNGTSEKINQIITKFDSYEYFLYYITGSESWPKYDSTYPYPNYSVTSSEALNWFGSTDEQSQYYNTGKNQIYSASRYDNNNQDYLYYLIPPFITENSSNDQYTNFVNMTGQAFDEMYLYTEAVEQVRNTNSGLTGSVLPLDLADEVITSLGFDTYANSFNSTGFNVNTVGVLPSAGSGLEYITRYIDIASGSVINYYDQQQSTLGYVVALADPSFPYPLDNAAQEIYKRIFHNMVSLVKRKGTVTGLRQLINIWGVPSTMLRISEFGGKNKNDENDYDLWMNRYSNAITTYTNDSVISSTTKASGSVRIPWTPLTSNYYEESTNPDIAVPDCIQFRFKSKQPISSDSIFSQSLLLKNSLSSTNPSDFGIVLQYSGSQSGSFSGSVIPTNYQYGTMQFVISGSTSEGGLGAGYFETEPITLPFFNDGWWSVQLQRKTHLSQSQENSTLNEYELRVANNIYDGYNGNQIGFQGSASITMPGGNITSSINEAWNKFASVNNLGVDDGTILGGFMNLSTLSGYKSRWIGLNGTGRLMGNSFIGQFQEFRYYRRALSSSQFNDYVMNPESIQGHADSITGAGSSYDLLSFRIPLGNELEYNNPNGAATFGTGAENGGNIGYLRFGGQNSSLGIEALGSIHPSLVNKTGTLYTSSFLNMNNYTTQSGYAIVYQGWDGTYTSAVTASYLTPNTEINYMDQPAAGIRNRIKNKIQVIDGNEYGTTLSPFRSIQQEFEQSSSYTEDLNSLEVGFSFQNEINDDIIATFGHGVVSDAIADPRFISESSDRYPELTRIAEDYFKKYQGVTVDDPTYNGGLPTTIEKEYDYNRLIKFYETSLFKAIKNYVPARTSLSTGIIVKQHLLERNKTDAVVGININTPMAKTPETGSDSWGYTTQTGFNSVMSQQNLLITSSINMYSLTGSAGGSVNKYNTPTSSITAFTQSWTYLDNFTGQTLSHSIQDEFYNGEYSGSNVPVELNEYNPYRIYADGSNKNPDQTQAGGVPFTPPVVNLAGGTYNSGGVRFSNVTATGADFAAVRATSSLLPGSGSAGGGDSSDALLFREQIPGDSTSDKTISIGNFNDVVRKEYVNIGETSPLYTSHNTMANNGKYLLKLINIIPYVTLNSGGINSGDNGNYPTVTFFDDNASGLQFIADVTVAGGSITDITITNQTNLNGTEWWSTSGTNGASGNVNGNSVSVTFTDSDVFMVQFNHSDTSVDAIDNLKAAIESSNGHNGSIIATAETNGSDNYLRLQQTTVGEDGNTNIYYTNGFADNTAGVIEASRSTGASPQYLAPTTLEFGVDTPSSNPNIYIQNAITNLTTGVTYTIDFDITNYATDGMGSSNFDVGLSTVGTPGGSLNGILSITYPTANAGRTNQNASISQTYTHTNGSTAMFFGGLGTYGTISNVSITTPPSVLGPKHLYPLDGFTIIPTSSWLFQNSPYNPIINNVSGSRKNSFLFDQDFDPVTPTINFTEGIPNDYALVISASQLGWEGVATANNLLEFSEVPDSNYTTTAIINPRYNGSKITSADYNFGISEMNLSESIAPNAIISPLRLPGLQKSSKIRFLNGETGSWKGDLTNEYQSAIDTRPIYFAHFKSSYENYELYNSTTFDIDQLIQVPFDSIQSEQAPIITSSQLNGNNENLVAVGSTFTPNRKLKAFYNQSTKQFRNLKKYLSPSNYTTVSPTLDYTITDNNSNYIIFPAQEILSYYTNEKTQQEVVLTHSFNAPIWVKDSINYTPPVGSGKPIWRIINTRNNNSLGSVISLLTASIQPLPVNTFSASTSLLVTGSSPMGDSLGYGLLYLQGMSINSEDLYQYNFGSVSSGIRSLDLSAPHLQLINSINQNIDIGDISYSTSATPYLFPDGTINTQITNSCAQWSPNEGDLFAPWPLTVSTFVQSPINPTANSNYRLGGGLPSFPSNPLKSTATKGIQNYFTYNYSMSVLTEYTEKILPIMIERGDEIRVSYAYPLLTDVVSNASKTNEIITQTFQVLGYEQPPPSLLFGRPLAYNGTSQLGWGSNEAMVSIFGVGSNEFEAIAGNLPPTGLYSPDSLKERFDLLATNQQNVIGLGLSTNDIWLNAFTGSIVSCKVESRWGEISGSSTTVAPTGSIRVKFRGYQGAIGANADRECQIQSVQEILRTTMGGVSGSYQEALGNNIPSSQYSFVVSSGTDYHPLDPAFIFDTLKVTPNPATLAKPIPNGSIMSATFKKRIDNDTKVVVNVTQPPGNEGALTPSGDGYLIPDDLTSTQMDNVQKIINVLKSQNSFTNPPDANETQDVS